MEFTKITIIGSMRFYDDIIKKAEQLHTESNSIVMIPFKSSSNEITEEEIERFNAQIRYQIDMSDIVYVFNKDGYIGESVKSEIEYAKERGKTLCYEQTVYIEESDNNHYEYPVSSLIRDNETDKFLMDMNMNCEFILYSNKEKSVKYNLCLAKLIHIVTNILTKKCDDGILADAIELLYTIGDIVGSPESVLNNVRLDLTDKYGNYKKFTVLTKLSSDNQARIPYDKYGKFSKGDTVIILDSKSNSILDLNNINIGIVVDHSQNYHKYKVKIDNKTYLFVNANQVYPYYYQI